MLICAVQYLYVQITTKLSRKRPPEVLDQLDVKLADTLAHLRDAIYQEGWAAQIHDRARQSFIHRNISRAEANDSFLITKRLRKSLPDRQRDVFDRVMRVDVQVTLAVYLEIKQT